MKPDLTLGSGGALAQRGTLPNPALVLPVGLAIGAFVIDLNTPFGVADGFLYLLAVLSCFWLPNARAALYIAAALMLPMTIGLMSSPPGAPISLEVANRLLGAATIWVAAVVVWHNARLHHERGRLLARIRELGHATERATYDARVQLSQWMHEGIAQELAAVAWGLDRLIQRGGGEQEVRALATELRAVIDDTQRAVRNRAAALRTPLESAELIASSERHVEAFGRYTGLSVATSGIANLTDVRGERADLCFAVVREALTNVAKHARARAASRSNSSAVQTPFAPSFRTTAAESRRSTARRAEALVCLASRNDWWGSEVLSRCRMLTPTGSESRRPSPSIRVARSRPPRVRSAPDHR